MNQPYDTLQDLGGVPVNQTNDLSDLGGVPVNQNSGGFLGYEKQNLQDIGNQLNTINNFVHGAGDAWRNTYAAGANMLPGVNISMAQTAQGPGYGAGQYAGNLGAFLAGGEVLDTVRDAAEALPYVGAAAQWLGGNRLAGVTRRALGNAMYGAMTNPGNRLSNSALDAVISPVADAIPGIAGAGLDAIKYLMPQNYAQSIIQKLGGGQDLEGATKSILSDIQGSYQNQKNIAGGMYTNVRSQITDPTESIYGSPEVSGQYGSVLEQVKPYFTNPIQRMNSKFMNDPTFENAHNLQSQIATRLRQIDDQNVSPDRATADEVDALETARGALIGRDDQGNLTGDMASYLNNISPDVSNQYKDAANYFYQNVAPYRNVKTINKIANGDITNYQPSAVGTIFKAPSDNMNTILSHLPSETFDKILFTKLGQTVPAKSVQGLLNSYQNLQQQGLGSYVTPELQNNISSLENRRNARSAIQGIVGGAAGALGGSHFGPWGSAIGGALGLGGAAIANPFLNYFAPRLPVNQIANTAGKFVANGLSKSYPSLKNLFLSNYLNNAQQGQN